MSANARYIRPAKAEDASRIAEILIFTKRAAYRHIYNNDPVSFGTMQVLPLALELRDDPEARRDFSVYDDGLIRGCYKTQRQLADDGIWEIEEFYVEPAFQGGGIGAVLMDDFLAKARLAGMKKVRLCVLEKNTSARSFYERRGFYCFDSEWEPVEGVMLLHYEKVLQCSDL